MSGMQELGKESPVAAFPVDPLLAAAHEKHLKKVPCHTIIFFMIISRLRLSPIIMTYTVTLAAANPPENGEGTSRVPSIWRRARCCCSEHIQRLAWRPK